MIRRARQREGTRPGVLRCETARGGGFCASERVRRNMLFVGAAGSSTCRCRDTTGLMLVLLGAVFEEGGVS